jgi:hypothetical protein
LLASEGICRVAEKGDCLADKINQLVERANDWIKFESRRVSDIENYLDGRLKFTFENGQRRRHKGADGLVWGRPVCPLEHDTTKNAVACVQRKIWYLGSEDRVVERCMFFRWNEQAMLVRVVSFPYEEEQFVPTKFILSMRFERPHGAIEAGSCSLGISMMKGFEKFIRLAGEGELDAASFLVGIAMRRDDFPVNMIKGSAKIVDGISTNNCNIGYYGFVCFDKKGSLSGLCVCSDEVNERSFFCSKLR